MRPFLSGRGGVIAWRQASTGSAPVAPGTMARKLPRIIARGNRVIVARSFGAVGATSYTAALAGLTSTPTISSISVTYNAPAAGSFTVTLDGFSSTPILSTISAAYTAPGATVLPVSASPSGHRLSTNRRPQHLSTRTR